MQIHVPKLQSAYVLPCHTPQHKSWHGWAPYLDFTFLERSLLSPASHGAFWLPEGVQILLLCSEPDWIRDELPTPQRRTAMPKPAQVEKSYSLWSIIKECIGKDLSKVCLPVFFNEPLSALQKSAEDLEYCELLDKVRHPPCFSDRFADNPAAFFPQGPLRKLLVHTRNWHIVWSLRIRG